jgi:hypothetical protein
MPLHSHAFLGKTNRLFSFVFFFRLPELGEQEQVSPFFVGEQSSQRMNQTK